MKAPFPRASIAPITSLRSWLALGACAALSAAAFVSACNGRGSNTTAGTSGSESRADAGAAQATDNATDAATVPASADAGGVDFRPLTGVQTEEFRRLYSEAATAYARRDFTAAARSFRALHDRAPSIEMAYNLARVYERMGETTEAIQFFQRVLQGQPPPSDAQRRDVESRFERTKSGAPPASPRPPRARQSSIKRASPGFNAACGSFNRAASIRRCSASKTPRVTCSRPSSTSTSG